MESAPTHAVIGDCGKVHHDPRGDVTQTPPFHPTAAPTSDAARGSSSLEHCDYGTSQTRSDAPLTTSPRVGHQHGCRIPGGRRAAAEREVLDAASQLSAGHPSVMAAGHGFPPAPPRHEGDTGVKLAYANRDGEVARAFTAKALMADYGTNSSRDTSPVSSEQPSGGQASDDGSSGGQRTPTTSVSVIIAESGDKGGVGGLVQRLADAVGLLVPPGGHISNIFNMASNTLGIGIVSMASGFNQTGICLSAILMLVCAVLVVFSFYLIGVTCERSAYRSWESACRGILFPKADLYIAGVMIFFQFGTMVGFVTAAFELILPFMQSADSTAPASAGLHRLLAVLVWAMGMLPLCLPRRVASLRYFSIVGVTLVIYFVFAVVAHSSMAGLPHVHDMKLFASGLDAVNGLTLFIFAFLGHGLCFRLFDEMRLPSAKNLLIDGCGSVSLISVLYFIVGFFGYAEFGLDMTGSIFKYYSVRDEPMMMVAYIGILLKICVAYALSGQACRLPVYYILGQDVDASSLRQHLSITIPLCVGSLILGLLVPDISIVFNLLGSICGGILAFLLPAFFVMYLGGWTLKRIGWWRLGLTYLNIITGVVAITFGTAVTINGIVKTYA